jgi:hypothetical protein
VRAHPTGPSSAAVCYYNAGRDAYDFGTNANGSANAGARDDHATFNVDVESLDRR